MAAASSSHFDAAVRGDVGAVVAAIEGGVSVHAVDWDGTTVMHMAAYNGRYELVRVLIQRFNASVTAKDNYGSTPMHCAAASCNAATIQAVLGAGGGCSDVTKDGNTALHRLALWASHQPTTADAALAVMIKCADIYYGKKNTDGRTAADVARETGNPAFAARIDAAVRLFWLVL